MEVGDAARNEHDRFGPALGRLHFQGMVNEIELDLKFRPPYGMGDVVSPRQVTYSGTCHQ